MTPFYAFPLPVKRGIVNFHSLKPYAPLLQISACSYGFLLYSYNIAKKLEYFLIFLSFFQDTNCILKRSFSSEKRATVQSHSAYILREVIICR